MMSRLLVGCVALLPLIGCAPVAATGVSEKGSLSQRAEPAPPPPLRESLFAEDEAVISNDAMRQILAARIEIPSHAKLAVVRFGQLPYWSGWNEDFVRMNHKVDDDFLAALAASPNVRDVAYLPSLVTPRQMTLPHLRAAAARFQSDLLLIYRTSTSSYPRQRLFREDETRAYCTVEAVLLDVRSGIIPFSTVVTEQFSARKQPSDNDFSETVAKANQQAIGNAWLKLARQLTEFLHQQPAATSLPASR